MRFLLDAVGYGRLVLWNVFEKGIIGRQSKKVKIKQLTAVENVAL